MQNKWIEIQKLLKNKLCPALYKVWIQPLVANLEKDENIFSSFHLFIFTPTEFILKRIKAKFFQDILEAATEVLGDKPQITLSLANDSNLLYKSFLGKTSTEGALINNFIESDTVCHTEKLISENNLPVKQTNSFSASAFSNNLSTLQLGLPLQWQPKKKFAFGKYSFDNFVTGPSNELAFLSSQSLCQNDIAIDTLLLVSKPGLGKTHLAQAVGSYFYSVGNKAQIKLEYITAEEFGSQMVMAIQSRNMSYFKERYRNLDVLLLEDIHFFEGKVKMQDEVLSTIKTIQRNGGRVVFSSSFAPKELKAIDSQLTSRFCSGFLAEIQTPCFETRMRLFKQKAEWFQVTLLENVAELLATHIRSDVRQIEGCLQNLILRSKLLNQNINLDLAWQVISQYAERNIILDMEAIIRTVCKAFDLSIEQLTSKSRKAEHVSARNTIFYLARKHTDLSLKDIGKEFNRTHTTVIKGITSLEREISCQTPKGKQIEHTLSLITDNGRLESKFGSTFVSR